MIWKDFGCAQFEEIGQHSQFMTEVGVACTDSGMRCVEIKPDRDVEMVAVVLLLSIFTKVEKMLDGLSSYRLRTQCFKHVVCRAVADCVLPSLFGSTYGKGFGCVGVHHWKTEHTQNSNARGSYYPRQMCVEMCLFSDM